MDFNEVEIILEEIKYLSKEQQEAVKYNYDKELGEEPKDKNSQAYKKWLRRKAEREENEKKARNYKHYIDSQIKAKEDLIDTDKKIYSRSLRIKNVNDAEANLFAKADAKKTDTDALKTINSFLHKNVSKNMDAKPADIPAFRASAEGKAIPGGSGYLSRWKHIVLSMLSPKGYSQSDEQNFLNHETKIATGEAKRAYNYNVTTDKNGKKKVVTSLDLNAKNDNYEPKKSFSSSAQGNKVIVSYEDYERIREAIPEANLPAPSRKGRQVVDVKWTRDKRLYKTGGIVKPLSKTSDYILDVNGKFIFVTFKSVDNQGGSQDNQVADVIKTVNALKSNIGTDEDVKAMAVIKGENIENRLQRDPNTETTHVMLKAKGKNGEMLVTNEYFNPIEIRTSSGKTVRVPRVVGYKEWLKIVENIKRYSN